MLLGVRLRSVRVRRGLWVGAARVLICVVCIAEPARLSQPLAIARAAASEVRGAHEDQAAKATGRARAENARAEKTPPEPRRVQHFERWSGTRATPDSLYGFAGLAIAPFGDIVAPGWRLRAGYGRGLYRYSGTRRLSGRDQDLLFVGEVSAYEALLGYQFRYRELTAKAFAGIESVRHRVAPEDPENAVQGTETGIKLALELWQNLGRRGWGAGHAAFSSAFNTFQGGLKAGYRLWERVALGLESGLYAQDETTIGHIGVVIRYQSSLGDIWFSGGLSGDYDRPDAPYASLTYAKRF